MWVNLLHFSAHLLDSDRSLARRKPPNLDWHQLLSLPDVLFETGILYAHNHHIHLLSSSSSSSSPSTPMTSSTWKFNKSKQNWLQKHVYDLEAIPVREGEGEGEGGQAVGYVEVVIKYLGSVRGGGRKVSSRVSG